MERLLQILDDIDDLFGTLGLLSEKLRNLSITIPILAGLLLMQAGGIVLALRHPPLALAMATLMFTVLLYRVVTAPRARWPLAASVGGTPLN